MLPNTSVPFHLYLEIWAVLTNFTVRKRKLLCSACCACTRISCINRSVDLHSIGSLCNSIVWANSTALFSKIYRLFQCPYCYLLEPSGGLRLEKYEVWQGKSYKLERDSFCHDTNITYTVQESLCYFRIRKNTHCINRIHTIMRSVTILN